MTVLQSSPEALFHAINIYDSIFNISIDHGGKVVEKMRMTPYINQNIIDIWDKRPFQE